MSLYLGLMSGTCMDGIDAALVDTSTHQLIHGITKKYSTLVTQRLNQVLSEPTLSVPTLCELNTLIGREFAAAALELLQEAKILATKLLA